MRPHLHVTVDGPVHGCQGHVSTWCAVAGCLKRLMTNSPHIPLVCALTDVYTARHVVYAEGSQAVMPPYSLRRDTWPCILSDVIYLYYFFESVSF